MMNNQDYIELRDKLMGLDLYVPKQTAIYIGQAVSIIDPLERQSYIESVFRKLNLHSYCKEAVVLYHFTEVDRLNSILTNNALRSNTVRSTAIDEEFNLLFQSIDCLKEQTFEVANELKASFFTSFFNSNVTDLTLVQDMYNTFGEVKMEFRWTPSKPYNFFLNTVYNSQETIELWKEVLCIKIGDKQLVTPSIMKLGFYFLPDRWKKENEVRLLLPNDSGIVPLKERSNDSFVNFLRFSEENLIGRLDLVRIHCENQKVFQTVRTMNVGGVPLSIDPLNAY
jgi:hypothetical protein